MSIPISEIAVVLPARNEAELLPAALAALEAARQRFTRSNPAVVVSIIVVLDSTTDNSRELLSGHPGVRTVSVSAGRVGTARNAGIAAACSQAGVPADTLWIANTDVDSEVPPQWIERQHELAVEGAHVVVGTVEPAAPTWAGTLCNAGWPPISCPRTTPTSTVPTWVFVPVFLPGWAVSGMRACTRTATSLSRPGNTALNGAAVGVR